MASADNTIARAERRRMMLEDPVAKVIPLVAIPMVITMLVESFYNLADTFFVSQLGTAATAAVGVNDSLMMFMRSVAMGFGMGASSYISRMLGAKKEEEASFAGTTALFTCMAVEVLLAAVCMIFMSPMADLLGSTAQSKPYTMDYAFYILLAAPFTAGEVNLSQLLRAEGSTRYSMIGMVSGCVINLGLDPLFISTFSWGVAGAAAATAISKVIGFIILLVPFIRRKSLLELSFRCFKPKWRIYREILRMGLPTFLRSAMLSVSTIVLNNVAGSFSDSALAAVSVAHKCTRFVGSAIMGFGQGFQPVAGYCWGAKNYKRVREAFRFTMILGGICAIILGTVMAVFSKDLVGIFAAADDAKIVALGSTMIRAECYVMILHVWVMIINGLFQALGRPISAAVVGLSRQVICLIPSVILLSTFWGEYGLASAQATADVLSLFIALPLALLLFRKMKLIEEGKLSPDFKPLPASVEDAPVVAQAAGEAR